MNKMIRILLIFTIFIIIAYLYYLYTTKYNTFEDNINATNATYKFKYFTYTIPDGLNFIDYDDNRFKIEGNGWYALTKIYYDIDADIYYDNSSLYIDGIKLKYEDIFNNDVVYIEDVKVLTFNKEDTKSVLCSFATDYFYDYEIEIFNDNANYSIAPLNEFIKSLLNPTWDENEENNYYYNIL